MLAVACWMAIGLSSAATPARAWTDTRVESADAHVDVLPDGRVRVMLQVGLRISGGWLSRFELEGLGERLELDPDKPGYLVSREGDKYRPTISRDRPGRIVVTFDHRKRAPWRGHYELGLLFVAAPSEPLLLLPDGRVRLSLQLPVWQVGLEAVDVWVTAPRGTRVLRGDAPGLTHEQRTLGALSLHHLRRPQLPRTVAWTVQMEVPRAALLPEAVPDAGPALRSVLSRVDERPGLWLVALLIGLCLLKQRAPAPTGAPYAFVIPLPQRWMRAALTLALGVAVAALQPGATDPSQLSLLLPIALSLVRPRPAGRAAPLRFWSAGDASLAVARQRLWAQRFEPSAWFDLSRPAGPLALAMLWVLLWHARGPQAAPLMPFVLGCMASTLWLCGHRYGFSPSPEVAMARLLRSRGALCEAGLRVQRQWAGRAFGRAEHARLSLSVDGTDPVEGLHRLDLRVAHVSWFERRRHALTWSITVAEGSPAERLVARTLPRAARVRAAAGAVTFVALVAGDVTAEARLLVTALCARATTPAARRAA